MKKITIFLVPFLLSVFTFSAQAAGSVAGLEKADVDVSDTDSLRRGAHLFVNYCLSCHSAKYMRYNRMGKDLGIGDSIVTKNMMFASGKIGEKMTINMDRADAKSWFGVTPPDLTVISRARGADWLYTYMKSFYVDDSSVTGWNNKVFDNVAMPNVLYELQGLQTANAVTGPDGARKLELVPDPNARLKSGEFDSLVLDLVNFLVYMGEPSQLQRRAMGGYVLAFLLLLTILMYLLKKEFWRDLK